MSTRCQIGFYKKGEKNLDYWEALIYRHSDGYPEDEHGVLATITPILEDFNEKRGFENIEYSAAWLVAKLKDDILNIGICKNFHNDIEYFYAIYYDHIDVYETGWDMERKDYKFIKTVSLLKG